MLWYGACPVSGPFSSSGTKGLIALNLIDLNVYHPATTIPGLIMHEFGHIVGFRHEHPWHPGGCGPETPTVSSSDFTGRRLTDYDITSVMHYDTCGKGNVDFVISPLDGEGSRSIYGMPAAWYVPAVLASL